MLDALDLLSICKVISPSFLRWVRFRQLRPQPCSFPDWCSCTCSLVSCCSMTERSNTGSDQNPQPTPFWMILQPILWVHCYPFLGPCPFFKQWLSQCFSSPDGFCAFRKRANVYFTFICVLMYLGEHTPLIDSSVSWWSTAPKLNRTYRT